MGVDGVEERVDVRLPERFLHFDIHRRVRKSLQQRLQQDEPALRLGGNRGEIRGCSSAHRIGHPRPVSEFIPREIRDQPSPRWALDRVVRDTLDANVVEVRPVPDDEPVVAGDLHVEFEHVDADGLP